MASRRDVVLAALATAMAGVVQLAGNARGAVAIGLDPFMAFSERLLMTKDLDRDMGTEILAAFADVGQSEALASLMAATDPIDPGNAMANAVVAAWYSGVSTRTAGDVVTDFNDALVWNAMRFTKAWGNCGGATGYWADPPTG